MRKTCNGVEQNDDIPLVFHKALGFLDHHFGNLNVTRCGLVERRADDFAVHRTLHVRDFFRPLVDQQHDQDDFRMVGCDRVCDRLKQHRLSRSRRSDDEAALSFSDRRQQVEHSSGKVFLSVRGFELQPLVRVQRRQIVEEDLVASLVRVFEVDGFDFDQGEVALSVFWRTHLA